MSHHNPRGALIHRTSSIQTPPDSRRTEIGELTELTASIREKGVLEAIAGGSQCFWRWMMYRRRASWAIGETWRPPDGSAWHRDGCFDDKALLPEIALIENMRERPARPGRSVLRAHVRALWLYDTKMWRAKVGQEPQHLSPEAISISFHP